jgi:uncharacterized protein YbjQ (UPF0145 family)
LRSQNIPWILQQQVIHNVAEEIRAAIGDERQSMADALDITEASEGSLARLSEVARRIQARSSGQGKSWKTTAAG